MLRDKRPNQSVTSVALSEARWLKRPAARRVQIAFAEAHVPFIERFLGNRRSSGKSAHDFDSELLLGVERMCMPCASRPSSNRNNAPSTHPRCSSVSRTCLRRAR